MSVFAATVTRGTSSFYRDGSVARGDTRATDVAWAGVCLLTLIAPFERLQPLLQLPGQALSTVETGLLVVFLVWLSTCARSRAIPQWRTPLTWPWIAFVSAMLAAAVVAPGNQTNALHMVGRFGLAYGVYLLTVNGVRSFARLRGVLVAAAMAGTFVAALAVLEYLAVEPVLQALEAFRERISVLGTQIRAGGPFQYPTIASMHLEITFALTLGLLLMAIDAIRDGTSKVRLARIVAIAGAVLLMSEAIILTFTRSGLITMVVTLAIVAALRFRQRGFDRGAKALVAVAALVAVQLATSRSFESLRLRLTTEGQEAWYRVSVDAPLHLTMSTGTTTDVPVTLVNTGRSTWDSNAIVPFRLSYHWLLADEERVVSWEGLRTDFPSPVQPGERASVMARVEAPRVPGDYRLLWDIEQEQRLWFSMEPGAQTFVSRATVAGRALGRLGALSPRPRTAMRPGRMVLWRAAARMFAAHPLTGVGADNYRLLYGPYAGLAHFDPRVHSNNMYVEILVGGGLVGGLAFAWLCWRAAKRCVAAVPFTADARLASAAIGILAAGAAIALHGLADSFLGFTGTYILIAITLGLAVGADALNGPVAADAHRI